ncbi:hypothetical protein [Actinokineospora iranica]|uniref:Uncharacterized protein n=1 Tax=Actinokineospora iranica TaxID=1271860 RepID=A0A1G6LNJ6_9PSEU|nr:hypothetical protein [Actinokineospora iranica]SDC44704.1 hypothetical protein SAMN05216174_102161 [Actinokineospora iranica]
MTEPGPVMEQAELARLTKEVGRALVRAAGPDWQRIRAEYRSAGRHIEVDVLVTSAGEDAPHPVRPPMEVVEGLGRIRAGMYRPGRGTWLSAVYEIEPPGAFACEFEPDVEPAWRRVPPPIGFADELRTFPRSEEFIPDWFRARAGLPPAVSSETQAAHTPPGGIELPTAGKHAADAPQQTDGLPTGQPTSGGPGSGQPGSGQPVGGQHGPGQAGGGHPGPGQPIPAHHRSGQHAGAGQPGGSWPGGPGRPPAGQPGQHSGGRPPQGPPNPGAPSGPPPRPDGGGRHASPPHPGGRPPQGPAPTPGRGFPPPQGFPPPDGPPQRFTPPPAQ